MSTNEFCFVCLFVCFFCYCPESTFQGTKRTFKKNKTKHPLKKEFFSSMESVKICQVSANEIKGERRISWKQSKFEFEI